MRPQDFSPENIKDAQTVLKHYARTYPSETDRKLFPELVQAVENCKAWDISVDDITDAIFLSKVHPFWCDYLKRGSLAGFVKPNHIEAVRQYKPESTEELDYNKSRWEAEDEKAKERKSATGFDENGKPILRVAVQRTG